MEERMQIGGLRVATALYQCVADEIAPGSGVEAAGFWAALEKILEEFSPRNRALLDKRAALQAAIDDWHRARPGAAFDPGEYKRLLYDIGYLVPEGEDFTIEPGAVDEEIARIAGPQLVVPATIGRYAVNAANARWGSLYDALYGSDVIAGDGPFARGKGYNPERGAKVAAYAGAFLDKTFPLARGSHAGCAGYRAAASGGGRRLEVVLSDGGTCGLADPGQFAGFSGSGEPGEILLRHHGLHVAIVIDRDSPVGRAHPAGVKDVILEAALTTIVDFEDSVAAVDGADKALVYRNWLGLMLGDLEAVFPKGGRTVTRRLNPWRDYTAPDGSSLRLPGTSLLLARNVGLHMTTGAVLDRRGREIFEGVLDAMVTALIARRAPKGEGARQNSRAGLVYIVKPKLHGPEETAFTRDLLSAVEAALGLASGRIKIGVMDEERRTSVNLKECVRQARKRVIFINTGFLDRTGDEIHTDMEAGPVARKQDMKNEPWIAAYEDNNVDVGLACGFSGRAQIGKGMWAKPDMMLEMVQAKIAHPLAGANCAWAPSPTAAVLHALHYHAVDVAARQRELAGRKAASLDDLLTLPLLRSRPGPGEIQAELDANAQSILGYVARWVDQGVGCSKVPDLTGAGLMEDRATLRISSQLLANWLRHALCTREQVRETFERMALVVDRQNAGDPLYRPMAEDFEASLPFQAALELVFSGQAQPCGYTEPILHAHRLRAKTRGA
ncbi:MAG: malate synthase G [Desulfovibrionaceae bacterium]|nr:malate synthase G [Desulfovibrionaceae bacterium]MBF0514741.1 malate synthase G [Desulfovibrionaceae bacterium]